MSSVLVCGTKSEWFCSQLSKKLSVEFLQVESKRFPDGESYVRIDGQVSGKDVVLAHSLSPPQNDSIWELLLTMEALSESRAKKIILYLPYIAYSRQDKIFLPGEPISIKALLQILSFMGASGLITFDIHKERSLEYFRGKAYSIIPVDSLSSKLREITKSPVIVAPDIGALQRAKAVADNLGCKFFNLSKKRDLRTGEVTITAEEVDVKNREVVILDDIISTGGTVAKAASLLRELGADKIYVAVTHALMVGDAYKKLKSSGVSTIIAANTLPPLPGIEYFDVS
ncbi:MAG: ribose-phosphate pyrophosphokinase, partial [Fervidicoccaceae archaeon]